MDTITKVTEQHTIINGVDVTALGDILDVIGAHPEIGRFQFRNSNSWVDGSLNKSTIKGLSSNSRT